jgi:uncharacterized protein
MKDVILGLRIFGLLLLHQLLVFVYVFGFAIVYGFQNGAAIEDGSITTDMIDQAILSQSANSLIFAGLAMIGFLYLLRYSKKESFVSAYRFDVRPNSIQLFLAVTIGFSALFFSSYILEGMSLLFPEPYVAYVELFENLALGSAVSVFIAVAVIAPLFEEVLFRGYIFDQFERRFASIGMTIVASGVLFGLYHLNIFQGVFASILGIVLGLSYYWTRSIWIPIIIHFANNALSYLLGLEEVSQRIVEAGLLFEIGQAFLAFVLFPFAIYTLWTERVEFDHRYRKPVSAMIMEDGE